ncbi:M1 family peptidase, partial [Streptomyces sp. NPDC002586]
MHRRIIAPGALAAASLLLAIPASAASYAPGAPGIGDPYYPDYGNGGYDVSHYDLRLQYQPKTDELQGTATILAKTTQDLSSFDLDFLLDVSEVRVNGAKAAFTTSGQHELVITPKTPLAKDTPISVVVRYSGVPSTKSAYGFNTWHRTPDGAVAADEPEAAWWWFPSNDHPSDKATYDVSVAVPDGTQAISNGTLQATSSKLGWTRYSWRENKPQATYLATLAIGKFDITTSTAPVRTGESSCHVGAVGDGHVGVVAVAATHHEVLPHPRGHLVVLADLLGRGEAAVDAVRSLRLA